MKKTLLSLFIFILPTFYLFAEKYEFEELLIAGIENPVCITLSPDGLQMIVIDWPKRQSPKMLFSNRPYLESRWGAAIEIESINKLIDLNTRIAGPCFSFDSKYLYFAANFSGTLGGMDIFYCEKTNNEWSEPFNLGSNVNSSGDENYPSVSGNNRTLMFTREIEMKKLKGFKTGELWMSKISADEKHWDLPEKLNTQINKGGIAYPKIFDDNKTLFYSGVVDDKENWKVYWAKRLTDIHWYLPVRLDTLASKDSEVSPVYCKQDGFLYFVKYDNSGFHPQGAIHRYKLDSKYYADKTIKVKGKISNSISGEPLNATVLVTDPVLGEIKFLTHSDSIDGSFSTLLNANKTYMFHVWDEGFSHRYQLYTPEVTNESFNEDFKLFPEIQLKLNIYDAEELWPLNGDIAIKNKLGKPIDVSSKINFEGQKELTLPLGSEYSLLVSMKDYSNNSLELDLSNIVLFDEFVRDIELIPHKRDLEIYVTDEETNKALMASIEIFDQLGNQFIPDPVKGVIGLYSVILREGGFFKIEVRGPRGFAFKYVEIDLDTDRDLKRLAVELKPLKRKVPIRLDNINFESNSAYLMESSFSELNRVVTLFEDNPDIHVEIMAHTDDIGSEKYNAILAEKRAKSVVEYLIICGINPNRLVAKGYGETTPLVSNDSDDNRALNRRVEMRILDENDQDYFIEERITK